MSGGDVTKRRLTVQTSSSYVYDPQRVQALHEQFRPDPDLYGNDPVYAVWSILDDSVLGAEVFENDDFDRWPESDEEVER